MALGFTLGELFAGPGGMALGAHDAARATGTPLKHGWANDYDQNTVSTYIANISGATADSVICQDVRSLDIESLSHIDGFAFGFPCNDYSLVGENRGLKGEFGPLFAYGVKVLEHHQPEWFVAENVSGLRSSNGGSDFKRILDAMRGAGRGYKLTPHLYRFEDYGVPQRRHRIIVVGVREDVPVTFRVPAPTHPDRDQWKTASEALDDIPPGAPNHRIIRHPESVVRRLELIDPGENAFNAKRMTDELRLNVKGATLSQIYKRLHPDRPSYTITGSGGGGTHGYHWAEPAHLQIVSVLDFRRFPTTSSSWGNEAAYADRSVWPFRPSALFTSSVRSFGRSKARPIPRSHRTSTRTVRRLGVFRWLTPSNEQGHASAVPRSSANRCRTSSVPDATNQER